MVDVEGLSFSSCIRAANLASYLNIEASINRMSWVLSPDKHFEGRLVEDVDKRFHQIIIPGHIVGVDVSVVQLRTLGHITLSKRH